ncbi:hypothetical protein [Lacinutrix sp.]|uniref:hypothetical protein n=1 Tax=Lacinutrix sp. TaxID=1937692 RepID=UPI0025C46710|nr:hypothetical protein [Lacinutrix sp.]
MINQIIILYLSIVTTFSFTSCNNSSENQMHSKNVALLELEDIMKQRKTESKYYYGIDSRFATISKTE